MEDIVVPIGMFGSIALMVWAVCAYRYKTKKSMMKLLEAMTVKGDAVTPEVIHALGIRPRSPNADLRTGVILIALAFSFLILGALIGEEEAVRGMSGTAMFPLLIGVAYVGLWGFIGRKEPATHG